MASLIVSLILAFVAFSLAEVYELSAEEKQEIMDEVNRLRKETLILRNRVHRARNPEEYRPIIWDDKLAETAQEVANRCKWGEDDPPHDDRFHVTLYSCNLKLTPQQTLQDLKTRVRDMYNLEVAEVKKELKLQNLKDLLKHHRISVEAGQYMGCGAFVHHSPELPVYLVCHFSRERKQRTDSSHAFTTKF